MAVLSLINFGLRHAGRAKMIEGFISLNESNHSHTLALLSNKMHIFFSGLART